MWVVVVAVVDYNHNEVAAEKFAHNEAWEEAWEVCPIAIEMLTRVHLLLYPIEPFLHATPLFRRLSCECGVDRLKMALLVVRFR